jgi:hypothetical protein
MTAHPPLDPSTLRHAMSRLEARLDAVVTYGAGGCPTCHDAELRSAIALLKAMAGQVAAPVKPGHGGATRTIP